MKNVSFDLTTADGLKKAVKVYDKYGWALTPFIPLGLPLWAGKKLIDFITKSTTDIIETQRKTAIDLIKSGKDNNVDKMTITLDQQAGLDIGADIEGIPIKCKVGNSGHMIIDVQYKNS
ncbi:MAG: hypothetical protein BWX92_02319 [Deltaproteobacteria bacterium ADurb.Bin135]|nr:MAG: hypothetical protein BWX92_02319 [Deltaproteobacteria bacterium ADurb.Bin135]